MTTTDGSPGRAAVAAHFTRVADAYDAYWSDTLLPAGRALVAQLPMAEARVVLDIGAGVGSLHATLASAAPHGRVLLVDRAEGMIARAPVAAGRLVADADHLPLRDGSVDAATLAFMLQYIDDPARTLREVRRVLRDGGAVGVLVWGQMTLSRADEVWLEALDAAGAPSLEPLATYYDAADTVEKLHAVFDHAGYAAIEVGELPWSDHPDAELFVRRKQLLGSSSMRLAAWEPTAREHFLSTITREIARLDPAAFRDESQVLLGIGRA